MLEAIIGLLPATTGRIDHAALKRSDIAYLPQQAQIDHQFPITVLDMVLLGHWRRIGPLGAVTAELENRAITALAAVGLADFRGRPIRSLSAGQFQRVLFARMLLQDARLILLDEPFTTIDTRTTANLLDVVHAWHAEQRTVIAVLHDTGAGPRPFPRNPAAGPLRHRLGPDRRGVDAGQSATITAALAKADPIRPAPRLIGDAVKPIGRNSRKPTSGYARN